MPDVTKCRQWLEKNFPDEFAKLTVGENFPLFLVNMCTWTHKQILELAHFSSLPSALSLKIKLFSQKFSLLLDTVKTSLITSEKKSEMMFGPY